MTAPAISPPAVRVAGLHKWFGATHALRDVSLTVEPATIHSLVGENGAGKSTMLGVLAGRVRAGGGQVELFGLPARAGDPRAARQAGIAAIYQELTIVPAMTAVANVFLGRPMARAGWRVEGVMRTRFTTLAADLGVSIDPDVLAGELSIADQQLLEIMRALQADARIMLFDEPTASLAATQRAGLHALMGRLKRRGVTMIFVSHNLDEVLSLSDRVTVFRDGEVAETRPAREWTRPGLVRSMTGTIPAAPARQPAGGRSAAAGEPVLRLTGLTVPGVLHGVDLELHQGEIVGVAGLVGSGRTSLLRALAGLTPAARGRLSVAGRSGGIPRTVPKARALGIAIVPEDRKGQGLLPALSAAHNIALADLGSVAAAGWVRRRTMTARATAAAERFALDPRRVAEPVRHLSGGNQQKVLLSRWVYARPAVLLADEPSRGIDVAAKSQIMAALRTYVAEGTVVLIVSSDFDELITYCDRIVVLARGRMVTEFRPAETSVSENDVIGAAFTGDEDVHV